MKTIELLIDPEQELAGITAVSLVAFPAIEENFVFFGRGDKYVLAAIDEAKQMLVGPALIPNKKIPRVDATTGEEYEVYFSPETVAIASQLYMKDERTNQHTYEHDIEVEGLTVVESWIIEDTDRDKSALYGFSLPVGSWMLSMKVSNPEVWQAIQERNVRGFSIEGYFVDQLIEAQAVDTRKACAGCPDDPEVLSAIRELVMEEMSAEAVLDGQPLFSTEEEATLYGELFNQCTGFHEHVLDGKSLFMPCSSHPE